MVVYDWSISESEDYMAVKLIRPVQTGCVLCTISPLDRWTPHAGPCRTLQKHVQCNLPNRISHPNISFLELDTLKPYLKLYAPYYDSELPLNRRNSHLKSLLSL